VVVLAPITITGAWVENPGWGSSGSSNFFGYLASNGLGSAPLGYALQTGANQLTVLPFANINTISVQFSGPVYDIGQGSLELVGGTGGGTTGAVAAPSVTGFTSDGSNADSWTLSGSLGNNEYVFAIATTGSSFGTPGSTQVTDANGAGISGTFTTGSSSFPSGNGLAGSTFDFFFNVLPGDGGRGGTVNSVDHAEAEALVNDNTTNARYNPYFDYDGAGVINTVDTAFDSSHVNDKQSNITGPTAPSVSQVVGTTSLIALELGVQETGGAPPSSSPAGVASNASSTGGASATVTPANAARTVVTRSESTPELSATAVSERARHRRFAATDEAVSVFDLADLRT
jgi:hypothetical protein